MKNKSNKKNYQKPKFLRKGIKKLLKLERKTPSQKKTTLLQEKR